MILVAIAVCEIAFWVVLLAGLGIRYLLHRPRLGAALLFAAPVIDAFLLVLVAADLLGGGVASWQHGVAALYIGISVAYGPRMVAWTDARFAFRFADGPAPERLTGADYTRKCWRDVVLTLVMAAVSGSILGLLILLVGDPARTAALSGSFGVLFFLVAIDVLWALSYTLWPRRPLARQQRISLG